MRKSSPHSSKINVIVPKTKFKSISCELVSGGSYLFIFIYISFSRFHLVIFHFFHPWQSHSLWGYCEMGSRTTRAYGYNWNGYNCSVIDGKWFSFPSPSKDLLFISSVLSIVWVTISRKIFDLRWMMMKRCRIRVCGTQPDYCIQFPRVRHLRSLVSIHIAKAA